MFKKLALGIACLGLLVGTATSGFGSPGGQGGGCPGGSDLCKVDHPTQIEVGIGYDLKVDIDFDVCIDNGFMNDDDWNNVQATIYQEGKGNEGYITQYNTATQQAAIVQLGTYNDALITQSGSGDDALILQTDSADANWAKIEQYGQNEKATIIQRGDWNKGSIYQWASNVAAIIIQDGFGNIGSIAQH